MGLTQCPGPDPISRGAALTASPNPSRSAHLVAEEEVAALVCELPEALSGAGGDDDGEVVAIRAAERGLVAGPAQGLGPGAPRGARQPQEQESQQQHAASSLQPGQEQGAWGGVIINGACATARSPLSPGSTGAGGSRSAEQAPLLEVLSVHSGVGLLFPRRSSPS